MKANFQRVRRKNSTFTTIMPKEMFVPADSNIREIESLADNGKGLMFFINHSYEEEGDRVKQILGVKFLKDTV